MERISRSGGRREQRASWVRQNLPADAPGCVRGTQSQCGHGTGMARQGFKAFLPCYSLGFIPW